jgi:predicted enzyme related to lactoylglutathione lyase
MTNPIVFFDIAGPDNTKLIDFYTTVFEWEFNQAGQFSVDVVSPLDGTIRQDPAEKRIYIGVTDVTAALTEIENNGNQVIIP